MGKESIRKTNQASFLDHGRIPPQAVDLEEILLGAAMLEKKSAKRFHKITKPEYFYLERHQIIADAIIKIYEKGIHPDVIMVSNYLKEKGRLDEVGGSYYVSQLINRISSTENFDMWSRIIQQKWMQREMIKMSQEITKECFENGIDVFDIMSNSIDKINKLFPIDIKDNSSSALDKSLSDLMMYAQGDVKTIYETGLPRLDKILSFTSSLMLIAGASGVGKTTWTTFVIKQLLERHKDIAVLWYVIDHESGASIFQKFYSIDTLLELDEMKSIGNKINEKSMALIVSNKGRYANWDIEFRDQPCFIKDIKNDYRIFCTRRPDKLNILLIDNLMRLKDNTVPNTYQTTKDDYIANMLADIYKENKEFNPLVIALHHFSDEQQDILNQQDAFRPREKHIRGSGRYRDVIEKIVLINWPGKYYDVVKQYPGHEKILQYLFIVEIIKNTFGKTGFDYFLVNHAYSIFEEIEPINKLL